MTSLAAAEEIISETLWEKYVHTMYPCRSFPARGTMINLLQAELDADFLIDPEDPENDNDLDDVSYNRSTDNFLKFTKMVNGLKFLNAPHPFPGPTLCGHTPLTYVLDKEPTNERLVGMLLFYGADPNTRDSKGQPPLMLAIKGDRKLGGPSCEVVILLLEAGANALARYKGKSIAQFAKDVFEEDPFHQTRQLVWESLRDRFRLHEWEMEDPRELLLAEEKKDDDVRKVVMFQDDEDSNDDSSTYTTTDDSDDSTQILNPL